MAEPSTEPGAEVTPAATPPTAEPARTFTEAEVNRFVQERLARDRKERPSDDDVAEWRDKAAKFEELEAASKTELEKATERAAKAEAEAATALERAQARLVAASILSEATGKFIDPTDADQIDKTKIEFDAEGNPTNVGDLVTSLLEAKPHLAATAAGGTRGSADQGARPGGPSQITREQLKAMSSTEIVEARKAGRLTGLGFAA